MSHLGMHLSLRRLFPQVHGGGGEVLKGLLGMQGERISGVGWV